MDTKDYFTLFGVTSALVISVINIYYTIKNRSNAIREHLFKEQIGLSYKLFREFSTLNKETDALVNNIKQNKFQEQLELINNFIYENEFILPNEIQTMAKNALAKGSNYYMDILSTDEAKYYQTYREYYQSYFDLIKYTRSFFGIDKLSDENRNLHQRSKLLSLQEDLKNSLEIVQKVTSILH